MLLPKIITANLCWHDPRSDVYYGEYMEPEDRQKTRDNCACDLCFYNRDKLATLLLRAYKALERATEQLKDEYPPEQWAEHYPCIIEAQETLIAIREAK